MKTANFLRKRAFSTKSQMFDWVKEARVLKDVNNHNYYLLDVESNQSNQCKLLPRRYRKLIAKFIRDGVFNEQKNSDNYETLLCNGVLVTNESFGSNTTKSQWVDVSRVQIQPVQVQCEPQRLVIDEPRPFYLLGN